MTLSLDPFVFGPDAAFTTRPVPLFLVLLGVLILGVVIGGVAVTRDGLHDTALVYSLAVAVLAAAAVGLLARQAGRSHRTQDR